MSELSLSLQFVSLGRDATVVREEMTQLANYLDSVSARFMADSKRGWAMAVAEQERCRWKA